MFLTFCIIVLTFSTVHTADENLYQVLGISRRSTAQEIKKAYKDLAKEWHPDRNKDPMAKEKFLKINEAYETLMDPNKRSRYDIFGIGSSKIDGGWQETFEDDSSFGRGESFQFGNFIFTFDGAFDDADEISSIDYDKVVKPESYSKPYLLYVHSANNCYECVRINPVWTKTKTVLEKIGMGVGTVNVDREKLLARRLRAGTVPTVVGVVSGKLRWFSDSLSDKTIQDFARSLFNNDLFREVNNLTLSSFHTNNILDNKVVMLIFENSTEPSMCYVAAAFAGRQHIAGGFVNVARNESQDLVRQYQIPANQKTLIFLKEDLNTPVFKLTLENFGRNALDKIMESHRFLNLPRVSSPAMFNKICPLKSARDSKRLCVILLTRKDPIYDVYKDTFRDYAERHVDLTRVSFGYVYEDKQKPFVKLVTYGRGAVNETLGNLKVVVIWRKTDIQINFDYLEEGWFASGADLLRSRRKLNQLLDWLLSSSDGLPNVVDLRYELFDEHARNIWIRIVYRIGDWWDWLVEQIFSVDDYMIVTAISTVVVVVVVGVGVRFLVISEDEKIQQKPGNNKSTQSQSNSKNSPQHRPTIYMHPLCPENYDKLVLQSDPSVRLILILVDEASRAKLLQYFANTILPYSRSRAFKFAFLQLEQHIDWYRRVLELTLGFAEPSQDVKRFLENINLKNCLGTVLAINGIKKYYFMYHISMTRSKSFWPDSSDDEEGSRSNSHKLFESDLLQGLGRWMEKLCEGSLKKFKVTEWPSPMSATSMII